MSSTSVLTEKLLSFSGTTRAAEDDAQDSNSNDFLLSRAVKWASIVSQLARVSSVLRSDMSFNGGVPGVIPTTWNIKYNPVLQTDETDSDQAD